MGKSMGGWLHDSYKTHGNSADGKSKGNGRNMDDTPKAKVAKVAKQTTTATKVVGSKSGGGAIKGGSKAPKDGKTVMAKGLMQKAK